MALNVDRAGVWLLEDDDRQLRCWDLHEHAAHTHTSGATLAVTDFPAYFRALVADRTIDASDARTDPRTSELAGPYMAPLGIVSLLDFEDFARDSETGARAGAPSAAPKVDITVRLGIAARARAEQV